MKKEIKVVISIVLAIWFFFMGFEIGAYKEKKAIKASADLTTTAAPVTTTEIPTVPTAPPTTIPTTALETTVADNNAETTIADSGNNSETTASTPANADPSTLSKDEILKRVTDAINQVKTEQNMTAVRSEKITINLTDLSIPGAMSIVNKIVQGLMDDEHITYNFQNGQATGVDDEGKEDGDGVQTPNSAIPPKDANISLTPEGVFSATAQASGDNTVYTVKLVEENTTYTAPVPKYNSAAFSYLDLTTIDLSGVTISDAQMHYPGTEITATVNKDGKLVELHYYMPMDGYGAAKVTVFNGNASFEGADDEAWTFTY
ncbi:MAG: hypothetical protein NC122_01665 [Faecalibacterium sp.]|nr:hypothetical protein [Ruminococcus sp.]MCM1391333.1 hypothetical protein [Ruminococcus sp.]MCM1484892.1 hypothetical protein [Faecalibacterium sp.]